MSQPLISIIFSACDLRARSTLEVDGSGDNIAIAPAKKHRNSDIDRESILKLHDDCQALHENGSVLSTPMMLEECLST